jgi:nucleotide-binding universal stress UspA family protein
MSFKTILVLLNDTTRVEMLLDAACAVTRQYDGHLVGLYVLPAAQIYSDVGMLATPAVFEGYRNRFNSKLNGVRQAFEARVKKDNLKSDWRLVDSDFPDVAESAIMHAHSADIIITCQIDSGSEGNIERDLNERLVMESGRPILIIPREGSFSPPGEGIAEKAIVGINGTRESTRALFDAIPLLRMVRETRLVWVDPQKQKSESGDVPCAEEAMLLSRHGINAVADSMATDGRNAGEALLMRANDLGADLLVMGAYAHSRMSEFVFGGATRHVLANMNIPVLVSH